jgi:pimeloyl-ACP methyl ester carboxylesterase
MRAPLAASFRSAAVLVCVTSCIAAEDDMLPVASGAADAFTEGTITTGDGARLYYRVVGTTSDTVVIVHGGAMGLAMDYIKPDLEPLTTTHTLIFYDQRGSGRSTLVTDPARMTVQSHVADLEAVRRHFGLDRLTLLGHSWGAGLAARYAAAHPQQVERLVLVGAMMIRNDPYTAFCGESDGVGGRRDDGRAGPPLRGVGSHRHGSGPAGNLPSAAQPLHSRVHGQSARYRARCSHAR